MSQHATGKTSTALEQSKKSPGFYVVEALDGVGKTSTGRALSNELGATYMETHSPEFEEFKDYVLEGVEDHVQVHFFLANMADKAEEVKRELEAGRDVVMDRYYPSPLAFHYAKTGESPDKFLGYIDEFDILEPDSIFYLTVDEEERLKRLSQRTGSGHQYEEESEFMQDVDEGYRKILEKKPNAFELEAVGGVENVVDDIISDCI